MNKKYTGYIIGMAGLLNIILLSSIGRNVIPFLTFLVAIVYGIYLLSKEDTPVKTLFDKLMNNKDNESGSSNQKINFIAIVAAGFAVISIFLPWLEVRRTALGITLAPGMVALVVALVSCFMAYRNIKWAFIAGAINFIIGIFTLLWFTINYGRLEMQIGWYLFMLASLVFGIVTFKNFKSEKAE
tara:strand:- start:370 stop:924 length:555 start_codon:yes stop_codon:yes gene_type:complete